MVTRQHDLVVIDPISGLVRVCAWCVPSARRKCLQWAFRCTDSICPACAERLQPHALEVTHRSGAVQVLKFESAYARGLAIIRLARQPVTLRILAILICAALAI